MIGLRFVLHHSISDDWWVTSQFESCGFSIQFESCGFSIQFESCGFLIRNWRLMAGLRSAFDFVLL
jgi:hypothetical protein